MAKTQQPNHSLTPVTADIQYSSQDLMSDDQLLTHLILREGHLWGEKDVTIPVSEIERIDENTVYLKLNKHDVGRLPVILIRRR